ncbi:hypothetical protein QBC37DRAFT_458518 [Rhypophila decipiens]|uniref:Uncharacterized protein n=1 Tax=Rhypophila decipiens TaxID=261697 RepID=A0AAN6XTD1_9PEZI|nr:hypothetical protein QBC37DRAFT_458518 [Rhypophila decipiens]
MSSLIQTCPGVCDQVYGSGNPDISGVGHLLPVARSIHQASIITSFSVLVAAVIRSSMDLFTVGERQFMNKLAIFEILTSWICTLTYLPLHASSMLERFTLIGYVAASLYLWSVSDDGPSGKTLDAIASWCINHGTANSSQVVNNIGQILHLPSRIVTNGDGPELGNNTSILFCICWFLFFTFFFLVFLQCVFGVLLMDSRVTASCVTLEKIIICCSTWPFLQASRLVYFGPRRLGALTIVFSLGAAATVLVWLLLTDLLETRRQMQALAGDKYEDNHWGFGQIAAVMTWVPMAQEVLFGIIRKYRLISTHLVSIRDEKPHITFSFVTITAHSSTRRNTGTVRYYRSVAKARQRENDRVALVELLARRRKIDANGQQTTELEELTPHASSEEHSSSDSELVSAPDRATRSNTHPEAQTTLSRTSSLQIGLPGSILSPRTTWTRNEGETYLPIYEMQMAGRAAYRP